jgi:hypothetical protein
MRKHGTLTVIGERRQRTNCTGPECTRNANNQTGLCATHTRQQKEGLSLTVIGKKAAKRDRTAKAKDAIKADSARGRGKTPLERAYEARLRPRAERQTYVKKAALKPIATVTTPNGVTGSVISLDMQQRTAVVQFTYGSGTVDYTVTVTA